MAANFKDWKDIHDYQRKLLDDDWTKAHMQFKVKNAAKNDKGDFALASSLNIHHASGDDGPRADIEEKATINTNELGGMMLELKATNKIVDGARVNNLNWKNEWKGLFKVSLGLMHID